MKQHIEAIHNEYKLLKCTVCGDSFEQYSSFHQHKEYLHESNTPYKCELCPESFDGENNLKSIMNYFTREINHMKGTF